MSVFQQFFGLREDPFRVNPDPRYLFLTPGTREALAGLAYGIQSRSGIILLTGEVGTGKTTLLQKLLGGLHQSRTATAFVFHTRLGAAGLFHCMMADFGIPAEPCSKSETVIRLNRWLLDKHRAGQSAVLIVDEAQNLREGVLEEIRLLTNLETATEKLLQIVLAGQPELEQKLKCAALRQLRQRITIRCRTLPLTREETRGYIAMRLSIAGAEGEPAFSAEAVDAVHAFSRGVPRVINVLCQHSLIHAFSERMRPVAAAVVEEVARDFDLERYESEEELENRTDLEGGDSCASSEGSRTDFRLSPVALSHSAQTREMAE